MESMRHTHHAQQWLPYPIAAVFDFFADPGNLPKLMPKWQDARIDDAALVRPTSRPPGPNVSVSSAAGQGSRMTISFRPVPFSPFRVKWDAEIVEFEWDSHFCDVQLSRGPFAYWRHCHRLEARQRDGKPGTLLLDQVDYEVPFGALGKLANSVFIARQMEYIFIYRHKCTEKLLAQVLGPGQPTRF